MIRIETNAGHGAGKPTAKIVIQITHFTGNIACYDVIFVDICYFIPQIEEHTDLLSFMVQTLGMEFKS